MKELNMNRAVFDQLYRDFSADQGLMAVMSQMQARYGISERKAYENADAVIRMVAEYENLSSLLSDDAMDVLDDFLEKARLKDADNWKFTLHRMRFGLMLYQEPELLDRLKEGDSEEALFEEYLRHTENVFMSEPWLEEDIHDRVRNYRIPPKVMRVITRQMEKDDHGNFRRIGRRRPAFQVYRGYGPVSAQQGYYVNGRSCQHCLYKRGIPSGCVCGWLRTARRRAGKEVAGHCRIDV